MNTTTNTQNQNENHKNGFCLYDIDNQPIMLSLNFEKMGEIEDDIERHINEYEECLEATSVIIEFNKLILTFNIKRLNEWEWGNADYDLELEHFEDA